MKSTRLSQYKNIHLIGIKGAGMTALAELLLRQGVHITGSDTDEIFFTDSILKNLGIAVLEGFRPENIPATADLVIYSTSYKRETNSELAAAIDSLSKRPREPINKNSIPVG
jgi:UDP-N-acetylmuramate--alanine ligase